MSSVLVYRTCVIIWYSIKNKAIAINELVEVVRKRRPKSKALGLEEFSITELKSLLKKAGEE